GFRLTRAPAWWALTNRSSEPREAASSTAWRTASLAVSDPSVPTTIEPNIGKTLIRDRSALPCVAGHRRRPGDDGGHPRAVPRGGRRGNADDRRDAPRELGLAGRDVAGRGRGDRARERGAARRGTRPRGPARRGDRDDAGRRPGRRGARGAAPGRRPVPAHRVPVLARVGGLRRNPAVAGRARAPDPARASRALPGVPS